MQDNPYGQAPAPQPRAADQDPSPAPAFTVQPHAAPRRRGRLDIVVQASQRPAERQPGRAGQRGVELQMADAQTPFTLTAPSQGACRAGEPTARADTFGAALAASQSAKLEGLYPCALPAARGSQTLSLAAQDSMFQYDSGGSSTVLRTPVALIGPRDTAAPGAPAVLQALGLDAPQQGQRLLLVQLPPTLPYAEPPRSVLQRAANAPTLQRAGPVPAGRPQAGVAGPSVEDAPAKFPLDTNALSRVLPGNIGTMVVRRSGRACLYLNGSAPCQVLSSGHPFASEQILKLDMDAGCAQCLGDVGGHLVIPAVLHGQRR